MSLNFLNKIFHWSNFFADCISQNIERRVSPLCWKTRFYLIFFTWTLRECRSFKAFSWWTCNSPGSLQVMQPARHRSSLSRICLHGALGCALAAAGGRHEMRHVLFARNKTIDFTHTTPFQKAPLNPAPCINPWSYRCSHLYSSGNFSSFSARNAPLMDFQIRRARVSATGATKRSQEFL